MHRRGLRAPRRSVSTDLAAAFCMFIEITTCPRGLLACSSYPLPPLPGASDVNFAAPRLTLIDAGNSGQTFAGAYSVYYLCSSGHSVFFVSLFAPSSRVHFGCSNSSPRTAPSSVALPLRCRRLQSALAGGRHMHQRGPDHARASRRGHQFAAGRSGAVCRKRILRRACRWRLRQSRRRGQHAARRLLQRVECGEGGGGEGRASDVVKR